MPFDPQQINRPAPSRSTQAIGPFQGIVYALDPSQIPDNAASDMRNVQVEDGRISERYGIRRLANPGGTFTGWGFDYVAAYNTSGSAIEEYIMLADLGSGIVPFTVNVSSGARTAITNGGSTPTALTSPTFGSQPGIRSIFYNNYSYTISPSESSSTANVYQHLVGTNTSWTQLSAPTAPLVAPKVVLYTGQADSQGTTGPASTMLWDDNSGTSLAYAAVTANGSGLSVPASPTDGHGTLTLNHSTNGSTNQTEVSYATPVTESMTITLNGSGQHGPGRQDFTNIDRLVLEFTTSGWTIQNQAFSVALVNSSGTTYNPTTVTVYEPPDNQWAYNHFFIVCDFNAKDPRWNYTQIDKITVSWATIGVAGSGAGVTPTLTIKPLTLGNINVIPQDSTGDNVGMMLGYTNYNSTTGLESKLSPTVQFTVKQLEGFYKPSGGFRYPLPDLMYFARPKLYINSTGSTSGFDHYNIYVRAVGDTNWYQVAQIATAATTTTGGNSYNATTYDATYDYRSQWTDILNTASITSSPGTTQFTNITCACVFNGGVVWGNKNGTSNIMFSQIGNPTVLYNGATTTTVDPNNVGAPANMTMADDGSDTPLALYPCYSALFALGSKGLYITLGSSPNSMSPFVRHPVAPGAAGWFSTSTWIDESGNGAVAYLDSRGEGIWLATIDPYFLDLNHVKVTELTIPVRGLIKDFLLSGTQSNIANVRMGADMNRNALWLICGTRAMVYRRPSLSDQQRHWELYDFNIPNSATIAYISFTTTQRMRWIASDGAVYENEWNSSSSSYITGTGRDAGNAPSSIYWTSKKFVDTNRRIDKIRVERQNLTDTPTITDYCTRESSGESVTMASGRYHARFSMLAQGYEHQFKIALADGSGYVSLFLYDQIAPLSRNTLS